MAEIIKRGTNHLKAQYALHTCFKCGSEIRFHRSDVKPDQRDGDYVECPVCRTFIASSMLQWGNETSDKPKTQPWRL